MRRVIVIGSGLGGLSCAAILAKNGYTVTVLEQGTQPGGCLQCFTRRGVKFETGMHFIGSAAPGQTIHNVWRYLEIADAIQLSRLDTAGYNVIGLPQGQFPIPNGRLAFIDTLSSYFPSQRDHLGRYRDLVERIAHASSLHSMSTTLTDDAPATAYQLRSLNEVVDELFTDPLLRQVIVGDLPLYAAERDKTPFSTHAFIYDFYGQGAYRIVGGSDAVTKALCSTIRRYGGEVRTQARATRIVCNDTQATAVEVNHEQLLPCDYVISAIHPIRTLELTDSHLLRPAFRNRVNAIPQTVGGFSLYLHFKPGTVPYMNHNYYGYNTPTPWDCERYTASDWPRGFLYMHLCHEPQPRWAQAGVVLSYMRWQEVARWAGTKVGRRGAEYEQFKQERAHRLIESLEQHCPDLRGNICNYYTSTPLTYLDYTGTAQGSMYGNAKDFRLGAAGRVPHRTRIPNLLLSGQNINSHGMLGVLVGTIVTCGELLGQDNLYRQIAASATAL